MIQKIFRYWFSVLSALATLTGLILVIHTAWYLPEWIANFRLAQLVLEIAVQWGLLLTLVALIAGALTLFWCLAGGTRVPPASIAVWITRLARALAIWLLLGVLMVVCVQWLKSFGIGVPFIIELLVFLASSGFAINLALWDSRRLDAISAALEVPGRRMVMGVWLGSLAVAAWGGVRWRSLDREGSSKPGGADKPSFLFVTFDALSAADMSLYGYRLPTTPNIDQLASRSIVFERFYSASSFTSSAVTSIYTGQNVPDHGWYEALSGRLAPEKQPENLAVLLQGAGYRTAAFVSNIAAHPMHLGLEDGFDVLPSPSIIKTGGFDFAYHLTDSGIGRTVEEAAGSRFDAWTHHAGLAKPPATPYSPTVAFEQAARFVEKTRNPFFAWVHVVPPHSPYDPPPPFAGRFIPESATTDENFRKLQSEIAENRGAYAPALQPEIDKLRIRYDEYIAFADHTLGQFLSTVKDRLPPNTVIIVSADHGENFNHGYWGHGEDKMWLNQMHIPLLICLPNQKKAGTRVRAVAGQIDLLPTVLDLAGMGKPPPWASGDTLRPLWEGTQPDNRTRAAIGVMSPPHHPISKGAVALVSGNYKYLLDIQSGDGKLFDIEMDPLEARNLAQINPGIVRRLHVAALAMIARGGGREGA